MRCFQRKMWAALRLNLLSVGCLLQYGSGVIDRARTIFYFKAPEGGGGKSERRVANVYLTEILLF